MRDDKDKLNEREDTNTKNGKNEIEIDNGKVERRRRHKGKHSTNKSNKELSKLKEKLSKTEQKLEHTYTEMVEYKNRYLRALADMDNYRKSVQKELEETRIRAKESLSLEIISILDNFERALKSVKKDNMDEHTISIIKGVEMIYKQFHKLLEKEGIRVYSSVGEKFDPRKHHALLHKEMDNVESDKVIEEYEKGYMLGDKILRPAKVIVSKKKENKIENKEEKNNGEE